ncbi:MAG: DUF6273 domain-containing protein [Clostridia bacterium]|nr:DUF6273 domain-containing protein [Clostridia bacterium]
MDSFECRYCGKNVSENGAGELFYCPDCGIYQPKVVYADEKTQLIYSRAIRFLRNSAFIKASLAAQKLLQLLPNDPEAHLLRALSRYGVRLVSDGVPNVTTLHKLPFLEDEDVKSCLSAESNRSRRSSYLELIKEIDFEQRRLLDIAKRQPPCDIYIVSDGGKRSRRYAEELCEQLQKTSMTCLYFPEDKENRAAAEFAAIASCRAMIAVGTDEVRFGSVALLSAVNQLLEYGKGGQPKDLILCYRDVEPEDLPDELALLPALDMERISFFPELNQRLQALSSAAVAAPEKLEEKAQSSGYYVSKLLKKHGLMSEAELATLDEPLDDDEDFRQALRLADEKLRDRLNVLNLRIRSRALLKKRESAVAEAMVEFQNAESEADFLRLENVFNGLNETAKAELCAMRAKEVRAVALEAEKRREKLRADNQADDKRIEELKSKKQELLTSLDGGLRFKKRKTALEELESLETDIRAVRQAVVARNREGLEADRLLFGSCAQFGRKEYAQEPIEWRLIDCLNGKALLVSHKLLFCLPYSDKGSSQWKHSLICRTLNHSFIQNAFSDQERSCLICGDDDSLFILSGEEAQFMPESERQAQGTAFAQIQGLSRGKSGYSPWWLRDANGDSGNVRFARSDGRVDTHGKDPSFKTFGVRPALWVDYDRFFDCIHGKGRRKPVDSELAMSRELFSELEIEASQFLNEPTNEHDWRELHNRYLDFCYYGEFAFRCAEADFLANGLVESIKYGAMRLRSAKQAAEDFSNSIAKAKSLASNEYELSIATELEREGLRRLGKLSRH